MDPRFSNSAARAHRWVPILPGTDAAFALGMMRWMNGNDRIDKRYPACPSQKASSVVGHLTWSAAAYLVRQPCIAPVARDAKSTEEIFIDLALKLGLPGYGKDGFGPGDPLEKPEHWYHKLVANIAYGDKKNESVPGATEAEMVQYVLDRGGRFEDYARSHKGDHTRHAYKKICLFFSEKLSTTRDSITGVFYDGLPLYEPLKDATGRAVDLQRDKYPFIVNTYHPAFHAQARTAASSWLMGLTPDECVEIFAGDADKLGIRHGDLFAHPSIGRRFRQVAEQYAGGHVTAEQILLDYESLMRVPGPAYAHPYESFYRCGTGDGKQVRRGALCGRPTLEVERYYRSEGLTPKYGRVDFADHIGAELSFMAHLCRRQAEALAEGNERVVRCLEEEQRRFASDHLFGWTEDFCKALEAGAVTQFFRGLARMLLDFVGMEKKMGQTPPMNG